MAWKPRRIRAPAKVQATYLPWEIVIDTAEQQPFLFQKMTAARGGAAVAVSTSRLCLGRHPHSLGDYSARARHGSQTLIGICHIERKSVADCYSTVLGFNGRRARFEQELGNLDALPMAVVVVESTWDVLRHLAPAWGENSPRDNWHALEGALTAYMQDYRVPWMFAGGRAQAELFTFRFLERAWRKYA